MYLIAAMEHGKYCTIRFPTIEDMGKAFEVIINDNGRFSGVDQDTITISGAQCEILEGLKTNNELNYDHLE